MKNPPASPPPPPPPPLPTPTPRPPPVTTTTARAAAPTVAATATAATTTLGHYANARTAMYGHVRFMWPAWQEHDCLLAFFPWLYVFRFQMQRQNFRPAFRVACVDQNHALHAESLEGDLFSSCFSCVNPFFQEKAAFYCGTVVEASFTSMCLLLVLCRFAWPAWDKFFARQKTNLAESR